MKKNEVSYTQQLSDTLETVVTSKIGRDSSRGEVTCYVCRSVAITWEQKFPLQSSYM